MSCWNTLGRVFEEEVGDVSVGALLGRRPCRGACESTKGSAASCAAACSAPRPERLRNVTTVWLVWAHELEGCLSAVRVEKVCKVFRVCVDACPVDRALCTTARKRRELLFRTKNMFISFSRVNFFLQPPFTPPSIMWIAVLQYT